MIIYMIATGIPIVLLLFSRNRLLSYLLYTIFVLELIATAAILLLGYRFHLEPYFHIDDLSILMSILAAIMALVSLLHLHHNFKRKKQSAASKSIFLAALAGLQLMVLLTSFANHLGMMWIFIEASTICVAPLIYFEKNETSLEAAWKYLFIASIGVAFIFVGILLFSLSLNSSNDPASLTFLALRSSITHLNKLWLMSAFTLIFVGLTVKMGVFPFYTVNILAHRNSSPVANSIIGTMLKNMGLLAVIRLLYILRDTEIYSWSLSVLIVAGVLSLIIAASHLLKGDNINRLLGYSSMEHFSLILFCIAIGTQTAYIIALLHLIIHTLAKGAAFLHVEQIVTVAGSTELRETGNYFAENRFGTIFILLILLTLTALPPSGLFQTELMMIQELIKTQHYFILISMLLALILIFYVLCKRFIGLLFSKRSQNNGTPVSLRNFVIQNSIQITLVLVGSYIGFVRPESLMVFLQKIVSQVFS